MPQTDRNVYDDIFIREYDVPVKQENETDEAYKARVDEYNNYLNSIKKIRSGFASRQTIYDLPSTTSDDGSIMNTYNRIIAQKYERGIGKSAKIFGIPHQFIDITDPRISESSLGRCFAEKILTEAPIVAIQPGKPDFLPGMKDTEKQAFFQDVIEASKQDRVLKSVFNDRTLQIEAEEDMFLYYRHKSAYSEMMSKVNVLCRILANFLEIHDRPWKLANGQETTYGAFDWRDYTTLQTYGDVTIKEEAQSHNDSWWSFIANTVSNAADDIMLDKEWIRFYVDANASYGESNSNRTTGSMLESFTEKLEGFAKELEFVSGMSGIAVNDLANSSADSINTFMSQHRDGPIGTLLSRITGATKQIIAGGNFLIPQIWSDSEYSKNYSFSITLTTPYGCKEAWFLNVGVPLMHLLALSLPQQVSANVYKSPYLVKCFSPGWFNCNLGIIDSINIEKGADSSWNVSGLPNEIKVSLSVTDLYATLALPEHPYTNQSAFLASGMLEFLAVNCGVDITHQTWSSRMKIWATILQSNIRDRFTRLDNDAYEGIKRWMRQGIATFI